jgi:hypothetical protein
VHVVGWALLGADLLVISTILVVGIVMKRRANVTGVVQFEPTDGFASVEDETSL